MKEKFKEFINVGVAIFGILTIISMFVYYWGGFSILLPQVFVGLASIIAITNVVLSKGWINSIVALIWIANFCIWIF